MVFARIVYKRKSGWRTGKHVYYKAENYETFVRHAEKNARGCEYAIQTDIPEEHKQRMMDFGVVFDLDLGCIV